MANGRIDENGLPVYAPGDYDFVRVVDRSTGASRNALAPEVTSAARALSLELHSIVQDARDDIDQIIRGLGYLPPVPYSSGLNVNDIKFTVSYNGDVYAPKPELVPFTTGAWNPAQWNVIQGDINLRSDLADPTGGGALVAFRQVGAGAVSRTLADKAGEQISVFDFMPQSARDDVVAGTLMVDCTPYIQSALESGAKKIVFPEGKYRQDGWNHLFKQEGIEIDAHGAELHSFAPLTNPRYQMLAIMQCRNVVIRGLVLNGRSLDRGWSEANNGHNLAIYGSHRVQLDAVHSVWAACDGIYVQRSSGGLTANGVVMDERLAPSSITMIGCSFLHNARQGMSIIVCNGMTCIDCEFSHTGHRPGGGISPMAGVDMEPNQSDAEWQVFNIRFIGCIFRGNVGTGCLVNRWCYECSLEGCVIEGNESWGLAVLGPRTSVRNTVFTANGRPRPGSREHIRIYNSTVSTERASLTVDTCLFNLSGDGAGKAILQNRFTDLEIRNSRISGAVSDSAVGFESGNDPGGGDVGYILVDGLTIEDLTVAGDPVGASYFGYGTNPGRIILRNLRIIKSPGLANAVDTGVNLGASGTNDIQEISDLSIVGEFTTPWSGVTKAKVLRNNRINGVLDDGMNRTRNVLYTVPVLDVGEGDESLWTVPGAELGDVVQISFNKALNGVTLTGWVSAIGNVRARFHNATTSSTDLGEGTLHIKVLKD